MRTKLLPAWHDYCHLRTEGKKLWAEANKLWAEGETRWAEAEKLQVKGENLWRTAVAKVCGEGATVEWTDTGCIVAGVMEFIHEN